MLHEKHPTRTLELLHGQVVLAPRWIVCCGALERYSPASAQELAVRRETRERNKAEREEAAYREANSLLTWVEREEAAEPRPEVQPEEVMKPVTQRDLFE
jgi:hypothetical protein